MFGLILLLAALCGAFLTSLVRKQKGLDRINTCAGWLLFCNIGLGGVWAFTGHAFFAGRVAESIGWPTSPFQFEIAMANLAVGVVGLLSAFFKGRFRLAAAIAANVYLLGCAVGHIRQMITAHNFARNNAGLILWVGDIAVPLLVLILVIVADIKSRKQDARC